MQEQEYVAVSVSVVSPSYGGACVENVYLVETSGGDPIDVARRIFDSRFGRRADDVEIEYERVTAFPAILERPDVVWLTPRRRAPERRNVRGG